MRDERYPSMRLSMHAWLQSHDRAPTLLPVRHRQRKRTVRKKHFNVTLRFTIVERTAGRSFLFFSNHRRTSPVIGSERRKKSREPTKGLTVSIHVMHSREQSTFSCCSAVTNRIVRSLIRKHRRHGTASYSWQTRSRVRYSVLTRGFII